MGQTTRYMASETASAPRRATPLRAPRIAVAADQSAELRRLRNELARTQRALCELKDATAYLVRHLI